MTDTETLTKAIELAIKNGWLKNQRFKSFKRYEIDLDVYGEECSWCEVRQIYSMGGLHPHIDFVWYSDEQLIYNHEFTKALWGTEWPHVQSRGLKISPGIGKLVPHWEHHLKNMVISPNPIAYLREHMEKE